METIEKFDNLTLNPTNVNIPSSSRKLASVQLVEEIKPNTNSDNLELAKILGWQVVIKKGEVKVGEKIIYFEIDSLLPENEWSEFLRKNKFRIKTIKLRGEISQGLILPLTILGNETNSDHYEIGQDLTQVLGVKKYDDDADLPSVSNGTSNKVQRESTFPVQFIDKTDEPRIQSSPKLLEHFKGKPYWASLKYDGTSVTYLVDPTNSDFWVCSRNYKVDYDPENCLYSKIADQYKIRDKLMIDEGRFAIQGEIYGPKLQKNPMNETKVKFVVFNARDIKLGKYLDMEELDALCKKLDLPMVETILKGDAFDYSVDELKNLSKGFYRNTTTPREGLVFKLQKDWYTEYTRCSFKIINDDFLLKKSGK